MVIAIDGPAGSGKSTIAKLLAEREGYTYINSGNLYRAITFGCLRAGIDVHNEQDILFFAKKAALDYRKDTVFLNDEDVTPFLHNDEIDKYVSVLSSIVAVRHIVNALIKKIAGNRDIVVEGRDMTTVVFPDTQYRFYLDASSETRAKRRFTQGVSNLSLEEIKKSIEERDQNDRSKVEGSLKIGEGVCSIDTSLLTLEQSYEKLIGSIKRKG
jgi:cytidylate kinase